jgi:hypothetical protein
VTAAEDAALELFVASLSATALQLPFTISPPLGPVLLGGVVDGVVPVSVPLSSTVFPVSVPASCGVVPSFGTSEDVPLSTVPVSGMAVAASVFLASGLSSLA